MILLILKILGSLLSTFSVGVLYAMYTKHLTTEKDLLKAAIYGELIVIIGAVNVISYTDNHWFIVPIVIGGFLGTLWSDKVSKFFNI